MLSLSSHFLPTLRMVTSTISVPLTSRGFATISDVAKQVCSPDSACGAPTGMHEKCHQSGLDALANFRKKPLKLNCAQTMVHAFADDLGLEGDALAARLKSLKKHGKGNAPEGLCGSLWSGVTIVEEIGNPECAKKLMDCFESAAGSHECEKVIDKVSCHDCVYISGYVLRKCLLTKDQGDSEERRVGKECRSRWSPDH
eukprot:TRINITY_DN11361_c0_g1_i1.p1 TRINITY_DN11361_c0_g1~~TRINITY_DN11361_c0_g1_i1.p1  ORF type:complete len:199 (-),score=32.26 TRINITY_DN11361_c0_g1_i1:36-632(-)